MQGFPLRVASLTVFGVPEPMNPNETALWCPMVEFHATFFAVTVDPDCEVVEFHACCTDSPLVNF